MENKHPKYLINILITILILVPKLSLIFFGFIFYLWLFQGENMDYTKWKSVAVRKDKYDIIKALCDKKYRAPAAFIAKLVDEYITFQASKNKQTVEVYVKNLLNGKHDQSQLFNGNKKINCSI